MRKYVNWLGDPDTFFVIAEDASGPVGYAFVTVGNLDAQRFYARHGFSQGFVVYHGKRPRR